MDKFLEIFNLSRLNHEESGNLNRLLTSKKIEVKVKVIQSCLTLRPHGLQPARLLCPWNSPGKNIGVSGLPFPSPGDPPNPGIKSMSPALQVDLPSELPVKPNIFKINY